MDTSNALIHLYGYCDQSSVSIVFNDLDSVEHLEWGIDVFAVENEVDIGTFSTSTESRLSGDDAEDPH